jgi:hypothetical protein
MSMRYPGGLIASSPVNAAYPSGVWTQPQTAVYNNVGVWQQDPYFEYTTLLLHGDGTNGAQNNTFLDSSTNNFTITRNGNTTQGAFTPYTANGYWGNYFDGSSNLSYTDSSQLNFGTGSYTIEFWINGPSNNDKFILGNNNTSTIQVTTGGSSSTAGSLRYVAGGNVTTSGSVLITDNAWHHCAIVRNGSSNVTLYVDGVSVGTLTDSTNYTSTTSTVTIAKHNSLSSNYLTGYLSNLRILKGTALYTANFTPPASPLTAISGTSLLTCQSSRFIDNSSSAFTLTVSGSPSVQQFNPFGLPTNWSAPVLGGSGYFDGTGDYLNGPTTGQFAPTGDFTISMWFYPTSFAASYYVLAGSWNAGASDEWLIQYDNTGAIRFLTTTDSTFSAAGVVKLNQWQFLSISRSGSTVTGYINGTSFRSYTLTGTVGSATKTVYVGIQAGTTWPYVGYISDYRLVAGSAQSATPPTSPATAISGTNTLLNFTNAGIFDNAQCNNLETVGNAQVSTSVVKYNTGSMAFDGSGDYLLVPSTQSLTWGTGDFSIEMWINTTTTSVSGGASRTMWGTSSASYQGQMYLEIGTGKVVFGNTGSTFIKGSKNVADGAWHHIAVCRNGTTCRLFVDGVQDASGTNSVNYDAQVTYVGAFGPSDGYFNGYIDDLRITKGYARYIGNFTPPIARFPNQG